MMNLKSKLIIFLLFLSTGMYSQDNIKLHLNARNAKDTSIFDYYGKLSGSVLIDSFYTVNAMVNYERDNGIQYYSYLGSVDIKYGRIEYYKDTEKDIQLFSSSVFYPVREWFKIGYGYMYSDKSYHLVSTYINWKWFDFEILFFDKVEKLKISINPEYKIKINKINKNVKIGFDCGLIYVTCEPKWNSGLTLSLKL